MENNDRPKNIFGWAEKISENPLYLTGISFSELGDLLARARKEKQRCEVLAGGANPPLEARNHFKSWQESDLIESAVLGELEHRQNTAAPDTPPDNEFFHDDAKMQKAFEVAHQYGLTHIDDKWCFIGEKTHAISVFWRAAVAAGLAKSDAPVYKVCAFLRERFKMERLGKNAIDKKKRIEEFGHEFQELYNKLLHAMKS